MATSFDALNLVMKARDEASANVAKVRENVGKLGPAAQMATNDMRSLMRSFALVGAAKAGLGALNVATEIFGGSIERAKEALFQLPFGIGEAARVTDTLLQKWSGVADQIERAKRLNETWQTTTAAIVGARSRGQVFADRVADDVRAARGQRSLLGLSGTSQISEQQRQDITEKRIDVAREFRAARKVITDRMDTDLKAVQAQMDKAGADPPKFGRIKVGGSFSGIMKVGDALTIDTNEISQTWRNWASEMNSHRLAIKQLRMGAEHEIEALKAGSRQRLTEGVTTISAKASDQRITEMRAEVMPKIGSVISSFADMIGTFRTGAEAGASGELARDSKQALQQRKEQQQALNQLSNKMDELIQAVKGIKVVEFGV